MTANKEDSEPTGVITETPLADFHHDPGAGVFPTPSGDDPNVIGGRRVLPQMGDPMELVARLRDDHGPVRSRMNEAADCIEALLAAATPKGDREAHRQGLIDYIEGWYDRTAGQGEPWTVGDLVDDLLDSGQVGAGLAFTPHREQAAVAALTGKGKPNE